MIAAFTATGSAEEVRSRQGTGAAGNVPDGGITYDPSGSPYSPGQSNFDSSNDFQLQGRALNDPASSRDPAGAGNVNDKAEKRDVK
jgi:hypothetical protein